MPTTENFTREDVRSWLLGSAFSDSFLTSLQRWLRTHDDLTERQWDAAFRNYRERVLGQGRSGGSNLPAPATSDDVAHIRNGVFTLDNGREHMTFQVYTPIRGTLQGKRIVKRGAGHGRFTGFAFLTTDGGLRVWRRFEADEQASARYIEWARILLARLNAVPDTFGEEAGLNHWQDDDGVQWTISYSTVCRRCNRRLTTPTSVERGIGPECEARNADDNRTVAADPQAAVNTAATEMNIARQEAEARLREVREREEAEQRAARALANLPMSELDSGMVL